MYSKYQEAVDALRHEQLGRKQSQAVLERVICDLTCTCTWHGQGYDILLLVFLPIWSNEIFNSMTTFFALSGTSWDRRESFGHFGWARYALLNEIWSKVYCLKFQLKFVAFDCATWYCIVGCDGGAKPKIASLCICCLAVASYVYIFIVQHQMQSQSLLMRFHVPILVLNSIWFLVASLPEIFCNPHKSIWCLIYLDACRSISSILYMCFISPSLSKILKCSASTLVLHRPAWKGYTPTNYYYLMIFLMPKLSMYLLCGWKLWRKLRSL